MELHDAEGPVSGRAPGSAPARHLHLKALSALAWQIVPTRRFRAAHGAVLSLDGPMTGRSRAVRVRPTEASQAGTPAPPAAERFREDTHVDPD